MKTKYTPGPWEIEIKQKTLTNINTGHEINVPEYRIGNIGRELMVANVPNKENAALIAAAPELLEALELLFNNLHGDCYNPNCKCEGNKKYHNIANKIIKVITKAKGK